MVIITIIIITFLLGRYILKESIRRKEYKEFIKNVNNLDEKKWKK